MHSHSQTIPTSLHLLIYNQHVCLPCCCRCAVDDASGRSRREGRYDQQTQTPSSCGTEHAVTEADGPSSLHWAAANSLAVHALHALHLQLFSDSADFKLVTRPVPTVGEGQVLIKVDACGVCGGDHVIKDGLMPAGQRHKGGWHSTTHSTTLHSDSA